MLEMNWIREHAEELQAVADGKKMRLKVEELLQADAERKKRLQETEELRGARNRLSEAIGECMQQQEFRKAQELKEQAKQGNLRLAEAEEALQAADAEYNRLLRLVPCPVSEDTPPGNSDEDNVEVRRFGTPPDFTFEPKDHVQLGQTLGLFDIPRGVKTAGSRSYYLIGDGFWLQRAVQQLALDVLARKGFTFMEVPLMAGAEALTGTGFFPLGEYQCYRLEDQERWLVGTSEVPLVNYYSGEIVDVTNPVKNASLSVCFRSEVGSAGRDTSGLYRVHQSYHRQFPR